MSRFRIPAGRDTLVGFPLRSALACDILYGWGPRSWDAASSFFASGVRELLATYAIVRTGNKQYRVQAGDSIRVESLPAYAGEIVDMDDVLMVSTDGDVRVGAPVVVGARVRAQVTSRGRGRKIRVFKYKPKVRYRRMKGHRQAYTDLRIIDISLDGKPLDVAPEPNEPPEDPQEPESIVEAGSDAGENGGEPEAPEDPQEPESIVEAGSDAGENSGEPEAMEDADVGNEVQDDQVKQGKEENGGA